METEIRAGLPVELRASEEDGEAIKVVGYAAVFNQEAQIGSYFRERFAPGAFTDAVKNDDVVFLANHEGLPLARTKSGTLILREDEKGLYMESELDSDDPEVMALVPKMKRGDLDKMSIAFSADLQEWDESDDSEKYPLRTIKKVSLMDVSIVTHPAYEGTEIGLRSLQAFRGSVEPEKSTCGKASLSRLRMKKRILG